MRQALVITVGCLLLTVTNHSFTASAIHNRTSHQANELAGTSWQLVKFQGGDDQTLTPDDKSKYTIAFASDGRVAARIDCNRGSGTWKSSGPNQLEFGPLALTRAMCPPGSLHDQIARQWSSVRSYTIKDGHLFLSLMADGGTYEYEPQGKLNAGSSKPPVASRGPFSFDCQQSGADGGSVSTTFYQTRPALVLIERAGETRPAFQVRAASGAKYEGKDVSFWEAKGGATLNWSGTEMKCKRR